MPKSMRIFVSISLYAVKLYGCYCHFIVYVSVVVDLNLLLQPTISFTFITFNRHRLAV